MADTVTVNTAVVATESDNPMTPFIEGAGTGVEVGPAATMVLDAADDIVRAFEATILDRL